MRRFLLLILGTTLMALSLAGQATDFNEGFEYKTVQPPMRATTDNGRVEVAEVFWYGCPHCYHLEPELKKWLANKPDNVDFVRIPAPMNPRWAVHSRAYYTAEAMGIVDKIHEPLFKALHEEHRSLYTDQAMAEFFSEYGVDPADYLKTARSIGVALKVRQATKLGRHWQLTGVPAIVVNGMYTSGVEQAGGRKELFELVNKLAAQQAEPAEPAEQ